MKRLLTIALLASPLIAFAQKHVYEDLLVKYVDEKYEDCMAKCDNYILNDDTKKDPLPYLYMSMCLFEISKDEKYNKDYPKAAKDALKYAEKYRRKDKEKEFFGNYEDYWTELNTMAMENGENFLEDSQYSKAKPYFDAMTGYYPENPGAWLMLAMVQIKSNLAKEGELSVKEFRKALANAGEIDHMPEDQRKLLRNSLVRYSNYLNTAGNKDSARATINIGGDYFMDDAEFKALHDELN